MHPVRKQRLLLVLFIALGSSLVVGLVANSFRENLNYFYPPSKIADAPKGKTIRAGGCVLPGSVVRSENSMLVNFTITDGIATLPVSYNQILPALFGEGEAAVVKGKLNDQGVLVADQVLAKHDESYTPLEVANSVKTNKNVDRTKDTEICKGLNYGS